MQGMTGKVGNNAMGHGPKGACAQLAPPKKTRKGGKKAAKTYRKG
jgi:hypothetical protein